MFGRIFGMEATALTTRWHCSFCCGSPSPHDDRISIIYQKVLISLSKAGSGMSDKPKCAPGTCSKIDKNVGGKYRHC
jgi:hypothetical protein